MTSLRVLAATGRAFEVSAGSRFTVVDPEGQQVGDLFAFCQEDPEEYVHAGATRLANGRLFPRVGESFFSTRRRPILTLVEDDLDGCHDMLIPACDRERYRQLGHEDHRNCADNLREALGELGYEIQTVPQPVNVFMPVRVTPDGSIVLEPSSSPPGTRIGFRAERDVVVALTACAQDLTDLNGERLSDLVVNL